MSVVLLDAFGTLLELEPPAPRLRRELAARFGVEVSLAEAEAAVAAEIAYYRVHFDEGRDRQSLASLRGRCALALRDALPEGARSGLPDGVEMVEALLASLRFDAFPDALETLPRLRREGRVIVVVSNWDVSLHEVLERVGFGGLLDAVVTSAEAEVRKPDVAIFERALALAGAAAGEAIHVGDSLRDDVGGARAAGIEPILLSRGGDSPPPGVRTISSLDELA